MRDFSAPAQNGARTLRACLSGTAAFALGYLLPGTLRLPVLTYDPLQRRFGLAAAVSGVVMRYYGDLLAATLAGACGAAVSWALSPRRKHPAPLGVAAATALSLIALDAVYYLSRLIASV